MIGRKLTKLLVATVILSQFILSCAFTSAPLKRTFSYPQASGKFRVTTSTSEEIATTQTGGNTKQQNPDAPTSSNDVVVVDGMPTLVIDEAALDTTNTYRTGLITIGFITLLFASNSPILRSAWESTSSAPPVLLINAAVSVIGLVGVIVSSPFLNQIVTDPSRREPFEDASSSGNDVATRLFRPSAIAGAELGLWKFLGTTANIYGLSQTSSDHGAFLIQLTTLIVPVVQGIMGVPIPKKIWVAIGLALSGVVIFTQDPNQSDCASLEGDILCALAAVFYATYDLRLFRLGKKVPTSELITTKMVTQSFLSFSMLSFFGRQEAMYFLSSSSEDDFKLVCVVALWSGLAVNCVAPYLQVSGQQAVGPAKAQILYASQPLWAAIMSYFLLGEACGIEGFTGGALFLVAMYLATTTETKES